MLMKSIRMISLSLVTTGAILFAGNAYSDSGVVSVQPQFDAPAPANTSVNNTATTANVPADPAAQLNQGGAVTIRQMPTSNNAQKADREFFRDGVTR